MTQVPSHIADGAKRRVENSTHQREASLRAIEEGRPLDAEMDLTRKVKRAERVAHVSPAEALHLVQQETSRERALQDPGGGPEVVQGPTIDFDRVSVLEVGVAAAKTVARVVVANAGFNNLGSGFLISERLFLTNNHVVATKEEARRTTLEFNFEMNFEGKAKDVTRFALDPDTFFVTQPRDDLDFTVVAIGQRLSGPGSISDFGYCPLLTGDDKHTLGEFVNIIQHPQGEPKQVVLRENKLVWRDTTVLHYVADTMGGASGSPVFNSQWEVIALHHWGGPHRVKTTPDGKPLMQAVNEGIRLSAIHRYLREMLANLNTAQRQLLNLALNPTFRYPSTLGTSEGTMPPVAKAAPGGGENLGATIAADGTVTWTIPLSVSVRLGGVASATAPTTPDYLPVTTTPPYATPEPSKPQPADSRLPVLNVAEKVKIEKPYTHRQGYNPNFLGGAFGVPLPSLSEALEGQAARVNQVEGDEEHPYELKYENFSIVMNKKRRMAFFTAVNIDGASWIHIIRETGEPAGAEAAELWFAEPRIDEKAQLNQAFFANQQPRTFDRGHLVRRQDPTWGSNESAIRANADTFHFTNATPQAWQFNQQQRYWQGIENYILENAKATQQKVVVFTGPVFRTDDPKFRTVKIPKEFWKILVRVEGNTLLATALLASQNGLLPATLESLEESFDQLGKVAEYQTTVREIERLTGLDFGNLRDHDTFQPTSDEGYAPKRLLTGEDAIQWSKVSYEQENVGGYNGNSHRR